MNNLRSSLDFSITRYAVFAAIALTVLVTSSSVWNTNNLDKQAGYLAAEEAKANWNKDQALRYWATRHGGLYVKPDERTPPNPYLKHLPNRDVETTDGVKLTLMNPAYMMSQMTKEFESLYGIKGKITGQVLLNPKNEADPWELNALKQFDVGVKEVSEQTDIDGQPYLRLMRPMVMKEGCVLCHGHLGFKVGDIRGGVSISVPLTPYMAAAQKSKTTVLSTHGGVWLIGVLTIGLVSWRSKTQKMTLQESEERLRSFIDNSPASISLKDRDGRLKLANKTFTTLYDVDPQKVIGKFVSDVVPEKAVNNSADHDQEVIETKSTVTKHRLTVTDNGTFDYLVTKFPILDKAGGIKEIGTIGIDITEIRQAEAARTEIESRFRTIVDGAPMAISLKDKDGCVILSNKIHAAWTKTEPSEIVGTTVYDFLPKEDADEISVREQHSMNTGKETVTEVTRTFADGVLRTVLSYKCPVKSNTGEVIALATILSDITERKHAEESALEAQSRFSGILDIAPEAIIAIGDDMNIRLFNQSAERIFGYKANEVLFGSMDMLMPDYLRDGHRKHVEGFESSKDTYRLMDQRQDILGLRKDGTEFPATASVSKLESGGETIYTVMLQDITERKHTQDALIAAKGEAETSSHAKSQFLAAVSHELRTPLNAILGFSQILKKEYFGPLGDKKYQEYAEDIGSSGELLLSLVDDLLDISTIEAGRQSLAKEELSTKDIVTECVKIVDGKALKGGIHLVASTAEDMPPLYADLRATKQILLNLLSNAIKFTPKGGEIVVSAKATEKNTTIKIADTGKGIPAEKLPELTGMFIRAEDDAYKAEKGWGLGLSITKSLVDLHGGKLDIESKIGKGTTVTVTIPNGAP